MYKINIYECHLDWILKNPRLTGNWTKQASCAFKAAYCPKHLLKAKMAFLKETAIAISIGHT